MPSLIYTQKATGSLLKSWLSSKIESGSGKSKNHNSDPDPKQQPDYPVHLCWLPDAPKAELLRIFTTIQTFFISVRDEEKNSTSRIFRCLKIESLQKRGSSAKKF